jgi:hypothetical protein
MAEKTYQPILVTSIVAAAALATVYKFVGYDGNYAGAGAAALGVLDAETDSGEMAPVVASGIANVIAGGAISVGEAVVSGATGKALAATALSATPPAGQVAVLSTGAQAATTIAGSVTPEVILGYALDEATQDGDIIRVELV